MAEYISREAIQQCRFTIIGQDEWICAADILKIPAADVQPVVTCGECKHYKRRYWDNGKCYGTFCDIWNRDHGKDFFCSAGKREVEHEA